MDASLTIIDNFYDEPDLVRDIALTCDYYPEKVSKGFPHGNAPWSGKMSKDAHSPAWIDAVVSKHLHKNLRQMRQLDSGKFRISKEEGQQGMFDNVVHADSSDNSYYAGVLYLSKDQESTPGTLFYKQNSTGLDRLLSIDQLNTLVLNEEDKDINQWNMHTSSNVVYNRLLIYPAYKFHGIGPCFGSTDDTARIVQIFTWIDIK